MAKTLHDLRELKIDVVSLDVDLLVPDPDNPNELTPEIFDALGHAIDRGFVQPVYVRRDGDNFAIIDGEHRWRIVKDRGFATIPCVVERDDISLDEARIRLLTLNRLRGELVPLRTAKMLVDLSSRIPEAELRQRLGMDDSELRDSLRLGGLDVDIAGDQLRETIKRQSGEAPVNVAFVLAPADADVVERAIEIAIERHDVDRNAALLMVVRAWLDG